MPFKTNLAPGSCPALSGFSVAGVEGRDAATFLQSQAMNDVAALAPGYWQWNGLLTPKGRVIALFALACVDEGRYLLVLPDHPAEELVSHLRRFVFRSKVTLTADAGWRAAAGPAGPASDPAAIASDGDGALSLDFGGEGGARRLWLLTPGHPALAPPSAATDAAWLAMDLAHGLPRLAAAQREAFTPQMLSLERLSAFSLRKGCYPGQEIVARTHYLGQAKRGLARLRGEGLAPGLPVETGGQAVGTVACADSPGTEALAVLALDANGPLVVSGAPCRREPLLAGLSRGV
jgi:folate-binding protein YgfZ